MPLAVGQEMAYLVCVVRFVSVAEEETEPSFATADVLQEAPFFVILQTEFAAAPCTLQLIFVEFCPVFETRVG